MAAPQETLIMALAPRRPIQNILELPLEIFFIIAFFLNNRDLANLRLVSKDFAWVETVLFRNIFIRMSPDLVQRAQDFINTRSSNLTIRSIAFGTIFAVPGVRGVRTWRILRDAIPAFAARRDIVNLQTVRMCPSSTELIPFLNTLRRCGITTIRNLDVQRYTGARGKYPRDGAQLAEVLAEIENLRLSVEDTYGDFFFVPWLLAECSNVTVFDMSYWAYPGRAPRCPENPFALGLAGAWFPRLRSLTLSNIRLDLHSFTWPIFGGPACLETIRLCNVLLQPTDPRRFHTQNWPNWPYWPTIWIDDGWDAVIRQLISRFENTLTRVEIRYPWEASFRDGDFRWGSASYLRCDNPVVKITGWEVGIFYYM
ncbi:hypothetical protein D8B26_001975 [Coccidioides posadasii str. Silveira]|uniref:Uncharacterized protein n=2 Tax=Coccidioides posadasii TaxID=199306 RepID=E9CX31_COCPS|nr:F-box domain containing protein [Coccidioides posadasii C735 delta SOWgp]EER23823.1 F-box domain containing protein [Coccidioides posadasii C735 delta SOWgp]EFW21857.1 conserved hypothetical protein [Coccidioides posadasii str. Silveira]QVM07273.1 hypothetical protein D8B26_001975 [Coccidioides posadasii str. Silveira]|eukprot:XP_003065968.1 F-box domain containing protein [Coccidioides posadasii C735 delta SOWgp]